MAKAGVSRQQVPSRDRIRGSRAEATEGSCSQGEWVDGGQGSQLTRAPPIPSSCSAPALQKNTRRFMATRPTLKSLFLQPKRVYAERNTPFVYFGVRAFGAFSDEPRQTNSSPPKRMRAQCCS